VCRFDDRYFESVYAISTLTGTLEYAIKHYKYVDAKGWAAIFGRVLVGFLDEKGIGWFDLITPSPTYVGPNGRTWDHTATVIAAAAVEAGARLPFDVATPSAIIQTGPTRKFVELSWRERKQEAEGPMRRALSVPNPTRVAGKRVLVFDDVFTEGFKIREVARALILAGAAEVSEVVLARVPAPANWA
jgi:predicted amidophosphoribosyltransferase